MLWMEKFTLVSSPATVTVLLPILDKLGASFWMTFGARWFTFSTSFATHTMWTFTKLEKLTYIIKLDTLFMGMGAAVLTVNLLNFELIEASQKFVFVE